MRDFAISGKYKEERNRVMASIDEIICAYASYFPEDPNLRERTLARIREVLETPDGLSPYRRSWLRYQETLEAEKNAKEAASVARIAWLAERERIIVAS